MIAAQEFAAREEGRNEQKIEDEHRCVAVTL